MKKRKLTVFDEIESEAYKRNMCPKCYVELKDILSKQSLMKDEPTLIDKLKGYIRRQSHAKTNNIRMHKGR